MSIKEFQNRLTHELHMAETETPGSPEYCGAVSYLEGVFNCQEMLDVRVMSRATTRRVKKLVRS